jgi:phosphoribosylformylglycinamidine (FGAM) synthase PurS component
MPVYEFAVELTVGDNTAFTVRGALRGLGYDGLERVERSDLFRLRMPDDGMGASDCAAALTHAEVVFNPNKHRLALLAPPATAIYEAVVADVDDDSSALAELLRDRFGVAGLEGVERATAWRLFERGGKAAAADRLEWACRSLLANKYSQSYEVRRSPTRTPVG